MGIGGTLVLLVLSLVWQGLPQSGASASQCYGLAPARSPRPPGEEKLVDLRVLRARRRPAAQQEFERMGQRYPEAKLVLFTDSVLRLRLPPRRRWARSTAPLTRRRTSTSALLRALRACPALRETLRPTCSRTSSGTTCRTSRSSACAVSKIAFTQVNERFSASRRIQADRRGVRRTPPRRPREGQIDEVAIAGTPSVTITAVRSAISAWSTGDRRIGFVRAAREVVQARHGGRTSTTAIPSYSAPRRSQGAKSSCSSTRAHSAVRRHRLNSAGV